MVRYRASCIGDGLPTNKQGEKMQRGGNPAKAVRLLFAPNIDKGCSRAASTSDLIKRRAVLAAVKTAPPYGGGLWPVLTAAARSAFQSSGRDGETALQPNRETAKEVCVGTPPTCYVAV
jgi:hypothetical protein